MFNGDEERSTYYFFIKMNKKFVLHRYIRAENDVPWRCASKSDK